MICLYWQDRHVPMLGLGQHMVCFASTPGLLLHQATLKREMNHNHKEVPLIYFT